ncbi:hypothetical protein CVCC1112_3025 [Paenarthrobacter nicotinovorans]|nr:hypothetical protein CVCC1112_3025 [Paenarthrobacter nicotinovorans]
MAVEDSLFCDSACMLSLPVASELVLLLMAAPVTFSPEFPSGSRSGIQESSC